MISVAVATYNGSKYIEEQLLSIKNQTVPVDEVVICDDCSTDNTVQVVNTFIKNNNLDNWHFIERETNLGFCMNFFDAISRTHGDYIFLADQDDRWYPNKVEKIMALFDDEDVLSVVGGNDLIDGDGNTITENPGIIFVSTKNDRSIDEITAQSQVGCNWIRGCAMCFKRELFDSLTPMKLDALLSHDWLISMEASLKGKNLFLNEYLFSYRYHTTNASLTAVARKELVGNVEKRLRGLKQSILAYEYLLSNKESYKNMTDAIVKDIMRQIKFESRRLKYLKTRNVFLLFPLLFSLLRYGRYYGSKKGGLKIFLGDIAYANHKITSKIKRI